MRQARHPLFILARGSLLCVAIALAGCGTSTDVNVAGPSISRCGVSVTGAGAAVPSAGGTGTLNVSAQRECAWSARSESAWITLSNAAGQGPATLTYSVEPNPNGTERRGNVVVDEQRVELVQQASPCRYDLTPASLDLGAGGSAVDVTLVTPGGCPWTAQLSDAWVAAQPSNGNGTASLVVRVTANTGAARTANLTVGGVTLPVRQAAAGTPPPPSQGCRSQIVPAQRTVPAAGEAFTVTITSSCAWAASSEASWIAIISEAAGTGNGTVRLQVSPNTGPARTGILRVGGETLAVDQGPGGGGPACTYTINPASSQVGPPAQEVTVDVRTTSGCVWTATSGAAWIVVSSGQNGSGNGTVRLSVTANSGPSRSSTTVIAGISFRIEQAAAPACTYSIKPSSYNAGPGPDDVRITVTTTGQCPWIASSTANWTTIAEGKSGTGSGTVRVLVEANSGAARSTTITIAGEQFSLSQDGNCEATLNPTDYNAGPGPDDFDVHVKANPKCSWTASSPVPWATIAEGGSETGNGKVRVKVETNPGAARSATLTIAGVPFKLTQEAARR